MKEKIPSSEQSRRQFFSEILPAGSLLCIGCGNLLSCAKPEEKGAVSEEKPTVPAAKHKFLEDSGMSFEEVYNFAFKEFYIPIMQNLANEIGKEEFIETLKRADSEVRKQQGQNLAKSLPKNDLAAYAAWMKENELYKHVLTYEIVEETDKAFEMKFSECLFAKTFREADAADIGYAAICHGEHAFTSAFNPEMKVTSTKTLMQGQDFCDPRWVLEA